MAKLCACGCGEYVVSASSTWKRGHFKRGKGGFALAEAGGKRVKPSELGTSGTVIFAGDFATDINSEFNDRISKLDKLEKMEQTDSVGRALHLVTTLPVRSIKWWVEPASESAEDKKIAESITWNLTEGMTLGFDAFLREALTCVSRGFSVFEKVFETNDSKDFAGTIKWRKFGFRAQRSIYKWGLDDNGGLEKIRQQVTEGQLSIDVLIPVEKLLVFTYQKEGSNYEGNSLFRACWRDYYYKDALQRIEAIGLERFWIGLPWIKLPKTATTSDKTKAFDIVTKVRGDEAAGLVTAQDWEFDILRVATEGGAMGDTISRYARNMFLSGLAQFLALGDKATGSWALSRDQSTFFLFSLNALANTVIADTLNKHAIPQLVKMNWPGVTKFPKMKHDDIEQIDLTSFAENVAKFVSSGVLTTPDAEIEADVRKMLGLPDMSEDLQKAHKTTPIDLTKGKKDDKEDTQKAKEPKQKTELQEAFFPPISDDEIELAIFDFSQKAGEFAGILDAVPV